MDSTDGNQASRPPPMERLQSALVCASNSPRRSSGDSENGLPPKRSRLHTPPANGSLDESSPKSPRKAASGSFESTETITKQETGQLDRNSQQSVEKPTLEGVARNREDEPTTSGTKAVDDDEKCAICLGSYAQHDETHLDGCTHKFCFTCINEWIKITPFCPLCKAPTQTLTHALKEELPKVISVRDVLAQAEAQRLANRAEQITTLMIEERNAISRRIRSIREQLGRMNLDQQMALEREQRHGSKNPRRKAKTTSAEQKKREREFKRIQQEHETLVTEMNALEILRDTVNGGQLTRPALIGNPLFRRVIYEENLRWSEVGREQNDMNSNRVPFTAQISIDERERHEERIRAWVMRELRVIFYNPSAHVVVDEQRLRRCATDIYSMTQNYPINAPQFSSFLLEEIHMDRAYIDQFQNELFEFASSNLPIEAHDANSTYSCPPLQPHAFHGRLPAFLGAYNRDRRRHRQHELMEPGAGPSTAADDDVQVVAEVRTINDTDEPTSRDRAGTDDDSDPDIYARGPLRLRPGTHSSNFMPSSSSSFRPLFNDFFNLQVFPLNHRIFPSFQNDNLSNLIRQIRMDRMSQERMLRGDPPSTHASRSLQVNRRNASSPPASSRFSRRETRSEDRERRANSGDPSIVQLSDDSEVDDIQAILPQRSRQFLPRPRPTHSEVLDVSSDDEVMAYERPERRTEQSETNGDRRFHDFLRPFRDFQTNYFHRTPSMPSSSSAVATAAAAGEGRERTVGVPSFTSNRHEGRMPAFFSDRRRLDVPTPPSDRQGQEVLSYSTTDRNRDVPTSEDIASYFAPGATGESQGMERTEESNVDDSNVIVLTDEESGDSTSGGRRRRKRKHERSRGSEERQRVRGRHRNTSESDIVLDDNS